jgi:hypothetical protein
VADTLSCVLPDEHSKQLKTTHPAIFNILPNLIMAFLFEMRVYSGKAKN